jgi:hypothetical protein
MNGSGLQPLDREDPGAYADLLLAEATPISTIRRQILFEKYEVQTVIVARKNEQVIPGAIAESPRKRPRVGHGNGLKFEQIDLQQPLLIGDQLNFLDRPYGTVGGNPEIPRRLRRPGVCVVTKPCKESCERISATERLDIVPGQIVIEICCYLIVHIDRKNMELNLA